MLGSARLFNGIVCGFSSMTSYLVGKAWPGLAMERAEIDAPPVDRDIVLDFEETQLSYGWLYLVPMRAAPGVAGLSIVTAGVLIGVSAVQRRRLA